MKVVEATAPIKKRMKREERDREIAQAAGTQHQFDVLAVSQRLQELPLEIARER